MVTWLAFAPSFTTTGVHRDFPLGAEKTEHERLHGLTFADLVSEDQGLLIVHSGCQYFRKESDGTWSNLVMREWESYFSDEYGFPNYAELTHSLLAHGPEDERRTTHPRRHGIRFQIPDRGFPNQCGHSSREEIIRAGQPGEYFALRLPQAPRQRLRATYSGHGREMPQTPGSNWGFTAAHASSKPTCTVALLARPWPGKKFLWL